uniref:HECT-type E3 ubiquitin transferase n=1 Tax=Heterorhabditis bacteriophora TaxID=37862 RepID=A0A1I7X997_HETBA
MFTVVKLALISSGSDSDDSNDMSSSIEAPPTITDLRNLSIIRSIPFVIPFMQRVKIFQELIARDKEAHGVLGDFREWDDWGGLILSYSVFVIFRKFNLKIIQTMDVNGHRLSRGISISVRRQHLYEDSFDALSPGNAPDLRFPIRVSMINWVGLDEIGIDGGGIFREFLTELLKAGFDADKGFFKYTHDRLLYPNPLSVHLYPGSYSQHYYFLGRIIAKTIDLKPGGRNIRLTIENRIEYIRLYANFFLYKRPLVDAMRAGVTDVIDLAWLAMFSPAELQTLISGTDADLDVEDMRAHCIYNWMLTSTHRGIQMPLSGYWYPTSEHCFYCFVYFLPNVFTFSRSFIYIFFFRFMILTIFLQAQHA